MISNNTVNSGSLLNYYRVFVVVIFLETMYNKTIVTFSFCDILNNQGLGKCYQPRPSAQLITLTSKILPYSGYHKNLSQ